VRPRTIFIETAAFYFSVVFFLKTQFVLPFFDTGGRATPLKQISLPNCIIVLCSFAAVPEQDRRTEHLEPRRLSVRRDRQRERLTVSLRK